MDISKSDRAELIQKGNRSFNQGDIEKASKIFETVKHIDELIRVDDDYYYVKNELFNSLIYYKKRIQQLASQMANVFKTWIADEKKNGK